MNDICAKETVSDMKMTPRKTRIKHAFNNFLKKIKRVNKKGQVCDNKDKVYHQSKDMMKFNDKIDQIIQVCKKIENVDNVDKVIEKNIQCPIHREKELIPKKNDSYCILEVINDGDFSRILKIKYTVNDSQYYTCKRTKKRISRFYYREIKILNYIKNRAIRDKRDYFNYFPKILHGVQYNLHDEIIYEYIPGNDLFNYVDGLESYNEIFVKKVARAIIPCLEKLAELELVHLDLKLENLIVVNEEPLKLKLIDMAFTRPGIFKRNNASIQLDKICGTEGYISPEVILNKFHKNTDLWSYGVILWLIFSNEYPFASKVSVYDLRYPRKEHKKSIQMMSENLKDFLLQIFTIIPEHRISLKQIKKHKFITRDVI